MNFFKEKDLRCFSFNNDSVNERLTEARNKLFYCYGYDDETSDLISYAADDNTPIYAPELYGAASVLDDYIQEGVNEGEIDFDSPRDFSLLRLLQQGYNYMLKQDLYEHLDNILYNACINCAEGYAKEKIENGEISDSDFTALVKDLESKIEKIVNNRNDWYEDSFKALREYVFFAIDKTIAQFKEKNGR